MVLPWQIPQSWIMDSQSAKFLYKLYRGTGGQLKHWQGKTEGTNSYVQPILSKGERIDFGGLAR